MVDVKLIKALNEQNPDYAKCHGITSLSTVGECNASRGNMMANNIHQTMVIINPEPPRVLSGSENTFGRLSSGYKKIEGSWEIVDKIQKFDDGPIYALVMYNKETNTADIIEKQYAEDGPERFGYLYNTKAMDSHNVGDIVKDEVLYKSTSYDENMNYNMGVNARTAYLTGMCTIEDGITINAEWAKKVKICQVASFKASINDNDIPILIHEYDGDLHPIPKLNTVIPSNLVCAVRRVNSRRIPYDYTVNALTHVNASDKAYKCDIGSIVYDMNIYYNNKTPFPETAFFKDLSILYKQQCSYYRKIYEWCEKFKADGVNRTQNMAIMHKRAKDHIEVMDGDYKWKENDNAFSNMIVEFKTCSIVSLCEGFKLVGRFGDKGVISEIRGAGNPSSEVFNPGTEMDKAIAKMFGIEGEELPPVNMVEQSQMMYDEDGNYVDIYLSAPGAYRRLNTGQLTEVDLTFISEQIRKRVSELTDLQEQVDLIFDFLKLLSDYEYKLFLQEFKIVIDKNDKYTASKKTLKAVVKCIIDNGFYIYKTADTDLKYDKICEFYDRYPFIQRKQMYVDKFGLKKLPVRHKMVVGWKYMLVLKQTTNKNFSARSMGRLNRIGIPAKSSDKKENRTNISDTPLNRGETYNLFIDLNAADIAASDIFTRNSPVARKDLKQIISTPGDPFRIRDWKIKDTYVNVNVQNFKARLKTLGIGYELVTDKTIRAEKLQHYKTFIPVYKYTFFDYGRNAKYYTFLVNMYNEVMRKGTDEDREHVWDVVKASPEFKKVDPPKDIVDVVIDVIKVTENQNREDSENEDD